MAASMQLSRFARLSLLSRGFCRSSRAFLSSTTDGEHGNTPAGSDDSSSGLSGTEIGLKKAFELFTKVDLEHLTTEDAELSNVKNADDQSFASLLKNSKLMQLGDPDGRVVTGKIIESIDDDLYIDFGGKFHCVCKAPRVQRREYRKGAEVRLRLHELEMSSLFLGATRDITLLEADATLIGLHKKAPSHSTSTALNDAIKKAIEDVSAK